MPRPNNATVVDACTQRLRALASYGGGTKTIAINGRRATLAEVLAIYEECLASRADLASTRAAVHAAMDRRASAETARREADQALRAWAVHEFGIGSKEAIDFGFPAPKAPVMSVEAKALAVARRKATREARHTKGRKQKLEVRGTVETAQGAPAAHGEP